MRRIGLGALLASVLFVPLLISAGNPLRQRVAALEAELNKQPVVIDANGLAVGTYADGFFNPGVLFDFEGHSLFGLRLRASQLSGSIDFLYFESTDCSGDGFHDVVAETTLPRVFYAEDGSARTFVSTGETELVLLLSKLERTGECTPADQTSSYLQTGRVTEMEGLFTPPYEIVTRGDLAH